MRHPPSKSPGISKGVFTFSQQCFDREAFSQQISEAFSTADFDAFTADLETLRQNPLWQGTHPNPDFTGQ